MHLMGATAIEDKLQDGVPDAIANLAEVIVKGNLYMWHYTKNDTHLESFYILLDIF